MRRTARVLSDDRLHKTVNWASLAGVIATAVLGYVADSRTGEKQEKIAGNAAQEIAVLQAWKDDAVVELRTQGEQIVQLRLAVAKLQTASEIVAQGYGATARGARLRATAEDVGELLAEPAPPTAGIGSGRGRGAGAGSSDEAPPAPAEDRAEQLKRKLLE